MLYKHLFYLSIQPLHCITACFIKLTYLLTVTAIGCQLCIESLSVCHTMAQYCSYLTTQHAWTCTRVSGYRYSRRQTLFHRSSRHGALVSRHLTSQEIHLGCVADAAELPPTRNRQRGQQRRHRWQPAGDIHYDTCGVLLGRHSSWTAEQHRV